MLVGKIKGYASFTPLAEEGAAEGEVALDYFFGMEGAYERSPTRFLPMRSTSEQIGTLEWWKKKKMREKWKLSISTTFNLNNGG